MNQKRIRNLAFAACAVAAVCFISPGAEARSNWGFSLGHGGVGFHYGGGHGGHYSHGGHHGSHGYGHSYAPSYHRGHYYAPVRRSHSYPRYYGHRGYSHCY